LGLKTIIIDDELHSIEQIETIIGEYLPELELIATFNNPLKALNSIVNLNPDLIFLDISMPQMSGFDFLDNIKEKNFKVVFITAYDEYAIKAFKYNAIDYLLKPIDLDILIDTVARIIKTCDIEGNSNTNYDKLLDYLNPSNTPQKIAVSTRDEVYYIALDEIIYIQAEGSYAKIILNGKNSILLSKGLKDIENQLMFDIFFRTHKSYLINLNYVKKFLKTDGGSVQMSNGDLIPISKRKRIEFNDKMTNFSIS